MACRKTRRKTLRTLLNTKHNAKRVRRVFKHPRCLHPKPKRILVLQAKDKPCLDCGKKYHPSLMDFDHRPGEIKSFGVSKGILQHYTLEDMLREIAKCDLVCCMCHRIRTWNRAHPNDLITAQA